LVGAEELAVENGKRVLIEGLQKAIKAESYGHDFYLMAARATEDPKGKEVFQTLAREEAEHMEFLTTQYRSILETGKPDRSVKLGRQADLSGMSPIFSDGLKSRLDEANFEMTSLTIGIQLEHDAMQYYRSQAEAAGDRLITEFYTQLADWETGHYRALLRQRDELKEDYWAASGFSPF
jgi:rubrerythrin